MSQAVLEVVANDVDARQNPMASAMSKSMPNRYAIQESHVTYLLPSVVQDGLPISSLLSKLHGHSICASLRCPRWIAITRSAAPETSMSMSPQPATAVQRHPTPLSSIIGWTALKSAPDHGSRE